MIVFEERMEEKIESIKKTIEDGVNWVSSLPLAVKICGTGMLVYYFLLLLFYTFTIFNIGIIE